MSMTYTWSTVTTGFFMNNLVTSGDQGDPAIASNVNRTRYFGAWDEQGQSDIDGRVIKSDGTPVGNEFGVNSTSPGNQYDSSLAGLANGNFVATFTDTSADPGGDIRARLFSPGGGAAGSDFAIDTSSGDDTLSSVAALTDGGFAVTWTRDFGSGDHDVEAAVFNANGSPRTPTFAVSSTSSLLNSQFSSIGALGDGSFVVAYEQQPSAGGDYEVYFRRYSASGVALDSSPVLIDTAGTWNRHIHVVGLQSVDGKAISGFAVAYEDNGWHLDGTEITLRIFNDDGTPRSGFIRVNENTTGDQDFPTITQMGNGYVLVGWIDGDNLMKQAYSWDGDKIGSNAETSPLVIEGQYAGLSGGLVANVRSTTFSDGSGDSIFSSIEELTRSWDGGPNKDFLIADGLRDTIHGNGGDDVIAGNAGNDTLYGDAGDDAFLEGAGNDAIDGGPGIDSVTYFSPFSSHQFTHNADGSLTIADKRTAIGAPDGTDTVINVERFDFDDGWWHTSALPDFQAPASKLAAFAPGAGGWTSEDLYPRHLADVNGDGRADIVGFGNGGVQVSLNDGGGNFAAPFSVLAAFGASAGGWTSDNTYHRELADITGDGKADIVGFAQSDVEVAVATGGGNFTAPVSALNAFAPGSGGWDTQDHYPRHLADVNGDGKADIVGFSEGGVVVALATGGGHFAAPTTVLAAFAPSAGGWSSDNTYHRELADVNGDHMADIVGFAQSDVEVALAIGGGNFTAPFSALNAFAPGAGGWSSEDLYPRHLSDVNGDGMADIVGFGQGGVSVALATGGGHFAAPTSELAAFAVAAGGWSSDDTYHRELADLNGDKTADIVGFGQGDVQASLSYGTLLI